MFDYIIKYARKTNLTIKTKFVTVHYKTQRVPQQPNNEITYLSVRKCLLNVWASASRVAQRSQTQAATRRAMRPRTTPENLLTPASPYAINVRDLQRTSRVRSLNLGPCPSTRTRTQSQGRARTVRGSRGPRFFRRFRWAHSAHSPRDALHSAVQWPPNPRRARQCHPIRHYRHRQAAACTPR